jgi:hypothetical protein
MEGLKQSPCPFVFLAINAGLLATGFEGLKALYETGKITVSMYFYALRYGPTIAAEEYALPEVVVTADKLSKTRLNVPGTKYYNPNYNYNMSAEDMIWGAKGSGKGLSTMGSATRADAMEAGKAWVGPECKNIVQNGELIGYSSKDGMRSFRLQYKPNEGMYRANFQENTVGQIERFGKYYGESKVEIKNVHVDIID